jgi:hypothetical protein
MPQFNVRVTREVHDAIAATVFVRELRSPQQLLGPLIENYVDELLEDDKVVSALKLREDRGDTKPRRRRKPKTRKR